MIAYLLDSHFGHYGQPSPAPEETAARYAQMLREARAAEAAGFGGIFVPDRHGRTECAVADPLTYLAAIAAVTERARIGTFSLVLTAYHPMHVAEQAAVVDHVSGGRLTLCVSMGYHAGYWAQFGIEPRQRVSRFEESLEVLTRAWSGERFSYAGRRFPLDDVILAPAPLQPGGPQLWLGGESRKAVERAARFGSAWAAGIGPLQREKWLRKVHAYKELAPNPHVVLMRDGFVAESFEEAARLAGDAIVAEQLFYYQANGLRPLHPDFQTAADYTIERLRDHLVIGSPAECVEQIERLRADFEVDSLVLRFRFPLGPDGDRVTEAIERFGTEVLPALEQGMITSSHA